MSEAALLRTRLSSLRRLLRGALVARGAGRLALFAAAGLAADFLLDWILRLPWTARAALLAAGAAAFCRLAWRRVVRPLVSPLDDDDLAAEVERRWAGPPDLLGSALQFSAGRAGGATSDAMRKETLCRAAEAVRAVVPARMVRWRAVRRSAVAGGAAAVLVAALALVAPEAAARWAERNLMLRRVEWPSRTRLALASAPELVPRGGGGQVVVRAEGVLPRTARLLLRGLQTGNVRWMSMGRTARDTFTAELDDLQETTSFRAEAGDAVLPDRVIRVAERPAVARARMVVEPPSYIGGGPAELEWSSPLFRVPMGSRLTVELRSTKPLSAALATVADGPPLAMDLSEPSTALARLLADRDFTCEFILKDTAGIESAEPLRAEVKAVPDESPRVRLVAQGIGEMVVAGARVPLSVSAADDYGVRSVRVEAAFEGPGQVELPPVGLWTGSPTGQVSLDYVIDLAEVKLPLNGSSRAPAPTGRLAIVALAEDACAPGGPNVGRSAALTLRLVSVSEFLGALLLRQQDLRRDLEQQMQRQRRLREALAAGGAAERAHGGDSLTPQAEAMAGVMELTAAGYADVLAQMLNNRLLAPPAHAARTQAIVAPLRELAAPAGPVLGAARAAGGAEALSLADAALEAMARVRGSMLLLEGYASLVASVREVVEGQEQLLRRTQEAERRLPGFPEGLR